MNSNPYFSCCQFGKEAIVGETLSLTTIRAIDSDIPSQKISYTLEGSAPTGLRFYSNGDIIWTHIERPGWRTSLIHLATDNGTPVKSEAQQ